ncbi:ATP-binding cassette domain-containing protein [Streptomyces sp. NPDC059452]|uniref:ATP-binding cassette domain-containing protein n=1 Tax=Streptomyces sp. NPDC059452 TaxID=3346835 RepID=UPI00368E18AD
MAAKNTEPAQEIITLDNVSKVYESGSSPIYALRNVSLALREGKFLAVMGEGKQGKSTLLRCISGEVQPTSGSVYRRGAPEEPPTVAWLAGPVNTECVNGALAAGPQVLLTDTASERDGAALREAVDRGGVAVVMTTAKPDAAAWADAVVFLRGGAVVDMIAGADPARISGCLERAARPDPS